MGALFFGHGLVKSSLVVLVSSFKDRLVGLQVGLNQHRKRTDQLTSKKYLRGDFTFQCCLVNSAGTKNNIFLC